LVSWESWQGNPEQNKTHWNLKTKLAWSNHNWSNHNWSNHNWSNHNWSNHNWSNHNWSNHNWSNYCLSNLAKGEKLMISLNGQRNPKGGKIRLDYG
jgi:hypothetical protein